MTPSMSSGNAPSMSSGNAPRLSSGNAPNMSSGNAPSMSSGNAPSMSSGNDVQKLIKRWKKDVNYSKVKVKSEFSPHKKEIKCDGQHEKKDIELGLWSWDDLNSEGNAVEGVLGVGSNSLKTVDRLSKSDEVGSDNVVHGFKDVKSLSSKQISVCNIVSDNDDMVANGNNSKVGRVCDADRMVSDPKKSIESETKGKVYNVVSDDDDTVADDNNVMLTIFYICDVSYDAKKSKSLSSKGKRVLKGVSVDLIGDDNKVVVGNECKSLSTELKSVDTFYKCDKEYEDVPKKRTPSLWQHKIVNRFGYVACILLCDNVSDGSPSIDSNLNEIVQKVKTKSINSLLDPKLKESVGVYKYKVINNCLNEEVVADTALAIGSGDQSLKDDCPVNSNQVCSGENLKDGWPVNSNEVCNYLNNGGDQSLKDGCYVNSNKVCNYQNNGGDENFKDGCHVNSNEVYCDDECENQGNNAFVEDVNLKDKINKFITSPVPSTKALVAEVLKCVNASFSSLKVEIKMELCSTMNDIVNFKVEISNLADKTQENVSTFKDFYDTFRYEAGGVEHVMTSEEIAKKKEDEEIVKRKTKEKKNRYRDSHVMSAEKEFIRLVEVAIEKKNDEYLDHKRIKLERMDIM
nr:hypothetical protein [Tanacetum cinerariifolium]